MEGSEGEAVFDAYKLNPQLFINEVLNAVDDMLDGAFDFSLQQASVLTSGGGAGADRSEELARGVSSLHHLTQTVLDKRMSMWEEYCLRHCFAVPEGFTLAKAQDPSSDGLLLQDGLTDSELDSQLESLRDKLVEVGKTSAELHREIHSLERQSTLNSSYDASLAEALQLFDQDPAHDMLQGIGEKASMLQSKLNEVTAKIREDTERGRVDNLNNPRKKLHVASDLDLAATLEDMQEVAKILKRI